jgi:hypothetical protein
MVVGADEAVGLIVRVEVTTKGEKASTVAPRYVIT